MTKFVRFFIILFIFLQIVSEICPQSYHFSNDWLPGKRYHTGHQMFRLKKGFHYFRLKKPSNCIFDNYFKQDILKLARKHSGLCPSDLSFIEELQNIR
uniref:Gonadotropin-releasing hormone like-1 n=1 Tax=Schmidtea mediterranea TaxID=79327 RepID=E3T7U7_SCHMD|nr:gonadotropin-releasing hormone like-1 [Schmidtea mediterranea]